MVTKEDKIKSEKYFEGFRCQNASCRGAELGGVGQNSEREHQVSIEIPASELSWLADVPEEMEEVPGLGTFTLRLDLILEDIHILVVLC